jgi:hypothetical protein
MVVVGDGLLRLLKAGSRLVVTSTTPLCLTETNGIAGQQRIVWYFSEV